MAKNAAIAEAVYALVQGLAARLDFLTKSLGEPRLRPVFIHFSTYLHKREQEDLDWEDLKEFRQEVDVVAEFCGLFEQASESPSSLWAYPLIRRFYDTLGIDAPEKRRHIYIYHSDDVDSYSVIFDIIERLPPNLRPNGPDSAPIDIYRIPEFAKHSLASIALLAHEVGHVFASTKPSIEPAEIDEALKSLQGKRLIATIPDDLFGQEEFRLLREALTAQIEEHTCDRIGRYLAGPAFDYALIEELTPFLSVVPTLREHPPEGVRIEQALQSLRTYECEKQPGKCIGKMLSDWEQAFERYKFTSSGKNLPVETSKLASNLAASWTNTHLGQPPQWKEKLQKSWEPVSTELTAFRPPFEAVGEASITPIDPVDALVVSVLYFYGGYYESVHPLIAGAKPEEKEARKTAIRKRLAEHLGYAISLHPVVVAAKSHCDKRTTKSRKREDSRLWAMRTRVQGTTPRALVIVPTLDGDAEYGESSVDLRLGQFFLIPRPSRYTHLHVEPDRTPAHGEHPADIPFARRVDDLGSDIDIAYEERFVQVGEHFILHPHQFVLAGTLEYVSLPSDHFALVLGRSTWGRLGLNIATATTVQAGFRGCLTLELRNLGESPMPLTVGVRIAQLCLVVNPDTSGTAEYYTRSGNKYIGPVRPEVPKISTDSDWALLREIDYKR